MAWGSVLWFDSRGLVLDAELVDRLGHVDVAVVKFDLNTLHRGAADLAEVVLGLIDPAKESDFDARVAEVRDDAEGFGLVHHPIGLCDRLHADRQSLGQIDVVAHADLEVEASAGIARVADDRGFEDDGVWDSDDVAIECCEHG